MNREALTKLVEILQKVDPDLFTMDHWDCGTAACAIGWGARFGVLPKGMNMVRFPGRFAKTPEFDGLYLSAAVVAAYGLTENQVTNIFTADGYDKSIVEPLDVARKIEELLNDPRHAV